MVVGFVGGITEGHIVQGILDKEQAGSCREMLPRSCMDFRTGSQCGYLSSSPDRVGLGFYSLRSPWLIGGYDFRVQR